MKDSSFLTDWGRAASELGIVFIAPFRLVVDGETFEFDALAPQFGSANGMLLMVDYQPRLAKVAEESGYAFSSMSENGDPYDATHFVDVLNEWGWGASGVNVPKATLNK